MALNDPRLGIAWLKTSAGALRRWPAALTGIVLFTIIVSAFLSSVPFAGFVFANLWTPYAAVLTGTAARDAVAGRRPTYEGLIGAFRDPWARRQLFTIGLVCAIWAEVVSIVFSLLAQDQIAAWQITEDGIDYASIAANIPWGAAAAAIALYMPILMATIFSPLLIWINRQRAGKSLFYSFFGSMRSIVPMLVYGAALFGAAAAVTGTVDALFMSLGWRSGLFFLAPIMMAIVAALSQAGIWCMFADIFKNTRMEPMDQA